MQIHQRLLKIQQAQDAGDDMTAADELLELHRLAPDEPGFLRDYVFAANGAGRTQEALDALLAYVDRRERASIRQGLQTEAAIIMALELALPYSEDLLRKERGLSPYSALDVDEPEFPLSEAIRKRWEAKAHGSGGALAEAKVAFLKRSWRDVDRYLDNAGRGVIDPRQAAARFSGPWFDDLDEHLGKWNKQNLPPKGNGPRVFIGCDIDFYERYGQWLEKTLEPIGIDFHCNLVPLSPGIDKYYCAATRLIRLHQLMEADPRPTIMLDADLLMQRPLTGLFERLKNADVALCRMPGRLPFHTQFNASVVGINPTERGLQYLRRCAGFIAKTWASGGTKVWCLDQISLLCTLREMQSRGEGPKAIAVGPTVYDGSYDADLVPQKVTAFSPHYPKYRAMMEGLGA